MTRWYNILIITLLLILTSSSASAIYGNMLINQSIYDGVSNLENYPNQTFTSFDGLISSVNASIYVQATGYANVYLNILDNSTPSIIIASSSIVNITNTATTWKNFNFNNVSGISGIYRISFIVVNKSGGNTVLWEECSTNCYSGGDGAFTGYDHAFQVFFSDPILIYPSNQSALTKTYPPLASNINLSWSYSGWLSSNLLIAKDSSFNLIVTDTTISTNYSVQALEAGNYWWKVRYYNSTSGTHGNYSDTFNFTLSNIQTTSGTNIQGTIYELLNGVQSNIDQAYVEIYNTTWTQTMVTGTNGYYLFQNLAADTYWVRAYKDGYDTTVGQAITPVAGITTTQNILMKKTLNQYVPLDHYVKFTVQTLWGTRYPNVLVSAFEGSDVIASKTGTTGTDGSTSLLLIKDQSYRITAVNASQGINTEITITPSEIEYYIIVTSSVTPWFEGGSQPESDVISFVVTSSEINATHAYINASYNDSMAQTTAWTIYLNQSNTTNGQSNQTKLQSSTGTGNGNVSFIVSGYTGKNYLVNLVVTHTTFGTVKRSYGVGFKGLPGGQLDFIPNILKAMIAIGLLIFVAAMFGQTSKSQGAGVVCAVGWILLALGFFAYFDTIKIAAGLTIATVFAIVVNMSERNKQEGMT